MSYVDDQLKQFDQEMIWDEDRKKKLETKILFTIDSNHYKNKTRLFRGFKYASNIGIMVILLLVGYYFLSNNLTEQSEGSLTGNEGNQTNPNPIIDDQEDPEEVENDENQLNEEDEESNIEILTGSTETIIRKVEGMDQEIKVINYELQPYGIAFQLDEFFGAPEVKNKQINYSDQYEDYKITLEMIEETNLEKVVMNLQEKFEAEGYDEDFGLESTPVEENGLIGKIQFYDNPVKGFIAYEIDEHSLVITFNYPVEGADGMYPLLETLRKSIIVQ